MTTIEERAYQYANKLRDEAYCPAHDFGTCDYEPEECLCDEDFTYGLEGYIAGATDQDRIARTEERERVMSAVIKVLSGTNYFDSEEGFIKETIKDLFIQCVNAELEKEDKL